MQSQTPSSNDRTYSRFFIIAGLVFLLDQLSKLWITKILPFGSYFTEDSISVVDGFFYLVHIGNRGAAWGLFEGQGKLLAGIALLALYLMYRYRKILQLERPSLQIIFGSMTGGILGNLLDRLLHGYVIDFLDFHFPFSIPYLLEGGRYPAFNIADSGIVIGVTAYFIMSCCEKTEKELN
jgi:signal peptidase II